MMSPINRWIVDGVSECKPRVGKLQWYAKRWLEIIAVQLLEANNIAQQLHAGLSVGMGKFDLGKGTSDLFIWLSNRFNIHHHNRV